MNNYQFVFETEARTAIHRDGLEDLLNWLHTTDFFTAPASTQYHGAEECGLVKHSLAVYRKFWEIAPVYGFAKTDENLESAAIVCLFHDICKADFYNVATKNVKDEETGKWYKAPYYRIDEKVKFGAHGAKSMYYVMHYMNLNIDEAMAIFHHMGAWDKSQYSNPGTAYSSSILAWLLHVADEADAYAGDDDDE